jgi:dGTPase
MLDNGHRQAFSVDGDRILHSLAYARYIDKTQVFSLIPNDHITHRVLHVQLVSKISRTIGKFLRLNEDLIEAIALGHDIGHPPFGHDGERYLARICNNHGLSSFVHSVQGVRFLQDIEKKGRGLNLTLQTLDGILCHDGELYMNSISPERSKTFETLGAEMEQKEKYPSRMLIPMTLEGCVVRMADVISYIGRDIEDAIRLNLIKRGDIPLKCQKILGNTNGKIVYRLVEDLISSSFERDELVFSHEVSEAIMELKEFNMEKIYMNPLIKTEASKIEWLYLYLFDKFLRELRAGDEGSVVFSDYLNGMDESYKNERPEVIVRDFIAGMTDAYFLRMGESRLIPKTLPSRF